LLAPAEYASLTAAQSATVPSLSVVGNTRSKSAPVTLVGETPAHDDEPSDKTRRGLFIALPRAGATHLRGAPCALVPFVHRIFTTGHKDSR